MPFLQIHITYSQVFHQDVLPTNVSGASDHKAILWELAVGLPVREFQGHKNAISAVALNDDVMDDSLLKRQTVQPENTKIVETVTKTGRVIKRQVTIQ